MSSLPSCLLLDMNDTFMFNADRFGDDEDFSIAYRRLGGQQPAERVNHAIRSAYEYLDTRYPDVAYRYTFPSVRAALTATNPDLDSDSELQILVDTFASHELGVIPDEYADAINQLSKLYTLGLVIDIWSPPPLWQAAFRDANISNAISATSFSSDIQTVKPAPEPFTNVQLQLNADTERTLVVGDSVRRDLGGAMAAGIECVLVGGSTDSRASYCCETFLDFAELALTHQIPIRCTGAAKPGDLAMDDLSSRPDER